VWSGNRTRHRLARTGNRQLNCAIHRIAVTQGRCHPDARAFIARRIARGNTPSEARRALKKTALRPRLPRPAPRRIHRRATPLSARGLTQEQGISRRAASSIAGSPVLLTMLTSMLSRSADEHQEYTDESDERRDE
jgi:hypothetical protein